MAGGALGRNLEHDPRSLAHPATAAATLVSVLHHRHGDAFDQGNLGSCTGNAAAGLVMSTPIWKRGIKLVEPDAIKFYSYATAHDNEPGQYPPDDTGSSGLAAAKALVHFGYIKKYAHAFGLQHALEALVVRPVITGVNWYDSFDSPNSSGHVSISPGASVRGGHEFEVLGLDVIAQTVHAINSWGPGWGARGYFTFSWNDWDRLLSEQGDVTVPA